MYIITAIIIIMLTEKLKYQHAKQHFHYCQSMIISRYFLNFWLTAAKKATHNYGVCVIIKTQFKSNIFLLILL